MAAITSPCGALQYALLQVSGLYDTLGSPLETRVWSIYDHAGVYKTNQVVAAMVPVIEYWGLSSNLSFKFGKEIANTLRLVHEATLEGSTGLPELATKCDRELGIVLIGSVADRLLKSIRLIRADKSLSVDRKALERDFAVLSACEANKRLLQDPLGWGALNEAQMHEWHLNLLLAKRIQQDTNGSLVAS